MPKASRPRASPYDRVTVAKVVETRTHGFKDELIGTCLKEMIAQHGKEGLPEEGATPMETKATETAQASELSFEEKISYADKLQRGPIEQMARIQTEVEKDLLERQEKQQEEGTADKKIFRTRVQLSMSRVCTEYRRYYETGAFLFFMGRVPADEEFKCWFDVTFRGKCTLQNFCFIGKGFYQVLVASFEERERLMEAPVGFKGSLVHTLPGDFLFA